MNQSEVRNWARANKACEAISRPEVPRLEAGLVCIGCSASCGLPTSELAVSVGGWLAVDVGGSRQWACSQSCVVRHNRRAPAEAQPMATVVPPPSVPQSPATTQIVAVNKHQLVSVVERPFKLKCTRCDSQISIVQWKQPGLDWAPSVERLRTISGWVERDGRPYCCAACASFRVASPWTQPVPVGEIPDKSYRDLKASQGRPRLCAQELPDGPLVPSKAKARAER
ncbi:MAG: hypothetical protein ABTD50_19400 [Polyangiaceae bacterium]